MKQTKEHKNMEREFRRNESLTFIGWIMILNLRKQHSQNQKKR